MNLVELRKHKGLTQKEAAAIVGIPYRTYIRYEESDDYGDSFKRQMILAELEKRTRIDEDTGILSFEEIRKTLIPLLVGKRINYCYLFGSYARGEAKDNSDVDLLVDTDITGLDFYDLVEEVRNALHKKIDLVRLKDLQNNNPIALEILKEGIRIL